MGFRKPNPGDPAGRGAGESLGSLQKNAKEHRNWYDVINEWGGKGVDTIDFSQRQFDENGRVKVTKYDVLLGRSQPELQAEYERQRQSGLRNSPANQQYMRDNNGQSAVPRLGEQLFKPQTMNIGDIQDLNAKEATRVTKVAPLLEELGRMDGGQVAIAGLPDKPTVAQVASVIGELTPDQPAEQRAAGLYESQLASAASQRAVAEGTLEINRVNALNSNALARAEIDFKNKTNEYNYRNAERERELKRDLTMLGFDDKDADRKYDREERRDQMRQLIIMQMLKGLQNFGSAFAL